MATGILTHYARVGVRRKGLPVMTEIFTEEEAAQEREKREEGCGAKPLALCQLRVLSCEPLGRIQMDGVDDNGSEGTHFESTVVLLTGRTHQIRAQFAKEGRPVVGDALYGRRQEESVCAPNRIGLHAHSLEIIDPQSDFFPPAGVLLEANTQWWRRHG